MCQVASVRIDAGFPEDGLLSGLEERERGSVAPIRNNLVRGPMAQPYLGRPVGPGPQEPRTWFYERSDQAASWSGARRVMRVVQERPDELPLPPFWLLTNWTWEQMDAKTLLSL